MLIPPETIPPGEAIPPEPITPPGGVIPPAPITPPPGGVIPPTPPTPQGVVPPLTPQPPGVIPPDGFPPGDPNTPTTPLALDLDGDGLIRAAADFVRFDLDADGTVEARAWITDGDGWLALDRNGDGRINDGSELFGSATKLATGGIAADGFAALGADDLDRNGLIDERDPVYATLVVWRGAELLPLAKLGVTSLSVAGRQPSAAERGPLFVLLEGDYMKSDGTRGRLMDVIVQRGAP